jgi:hypothetical protein
MADHITDRRLFCLTARDEEAFARVLREVYPDIRMHDVDTKKEVFDFRFRSGHAEIDLPSLIDPARCSFQYNRVSWIMADPYLDWVFGDPRTIALVEFGASFNPDDADAKKAAQEAFDMLTLITWKSEVAGDELFFLGPKEGELAYHGLSTAIRSGSGSAVKLNRYYDDSLWPKPKKPRNKSGRAKSST